MKGKAVTISKEVEEKILKTRINLDFPIAKGKTVIILREDEEMTSESGIIIPETSDAQKMRGKVMSVGSQVSEPFIDHQGIERLLQPGDKVLFNIYANLNIIYKDISYVVMSELDVYAILPDNVNVNTERHKSRKGTKDAREV